MVARLEPGSIVIVHTVALVDYVRRMIYDLRGSEFARSCRVRCVHTEDDARGALAGQSLPVAIDHSFRDYAGMYVQEVVERLAARSTARAKKTDCRA